MTTIEDDCLTKNQDASSRVVFLGSLKKEQILTVKI